jgi:hypothetical protein
MTSRSRHSSLAEDAAALGCTCSNNPKRYSKRGNRRYLQTQPKVWLTGNPPEDAALLFMVFSYQQGTMIGEKARFVTFGKQFVFTLN